MATPPDSNECRLKAESLEMLALTVSYRPDRERFAAEALVWREREAAALALKAKT